MGLRTRDNQVERLSRGNGKDGLIVWNALNAPAFARQNVVNQIIDIGTGINHERSSPWSC